MDGRFTIVDFKTSKRLYLEHRIQLAAYSQLAKQHYGEKPDKYLLQLSKRDGSFHPHYFLGEDLRDELLVFKHCRDLHDLKESVA